MTDIADLIDIPQRRLEFLMKDFVDRLGEKHRKEERRLDDLFEEQRRRIHRLHSKEQSAYKTLFDELLVQLNRDEDAEILEWFEFIVKTRRKDLVGEVLARTKPVIREIEREGGDMEFDIRRGGGGSSGCLFRDRKGGYFSFVDEFLDGYDDDVAFLVQRTTKSEAERKRERDARMDEHIARWRAEERAKRVDAEAAAAAIDGVSLKEKSAEEAVASMAE